MVWKHKITIRTGLVLRGERPDCWSWRGGLSKGVLQQACVWEALGHGNADSRILEALKQHSPFVD